LTFSTERKWMGTLGTSPRGQQPVFHAKGAPEIVLERCTHVLTPRGREPLSDHQTRIMQRLADFQRRGMRTLGVAFRDGFPLRARRISKRWLRI
jgi:P-type Ca2+ transporter type 2C